MNEQSQLPQLQPAEPARHLRRSRSNRVIAGVCGGLGEYLGLDPVLLRIALVLLVFAGVLGGLMSFGLVGLFIGPVVLAVAHKLLGAWVAQGEPAPQAAEPAAGAATTSP